MCNLESPLYAGFLGPLLTYKQLKNFLKEFHMPYARLVLSSLVCAVAAVPALAVTIPTGSVAVATGNSQVKVFSPTGTLLETLNDGSNTTYTTGMAFDSSGSLFVTNFGAQNISKFDSNGNLVSSAYMTASNTPESILINRSGNFLVGGARVNTVLQYSSAGGAPTATYTVQGGNGTNSTDWIDLAADQHTLLYDGEGTTILSYDLATHTQNKAFASGLTASVYAIRIIPSGPYAEDVLAADSTHALLLDASGNILKTYTLPGNDGGDFALNLDPNGTDFWTADPSGTVWEVNIATGKIDNQFNSGSSSTFGLVVSGELTAGGPPPTTSVTPEPGTLTLMGTGLAGLAALRRRWKKA